MSSINSDLSLSTSENGLSQQLAPPESTSKHTAQPASDSLSKPLTSQEIQVPIPSQKTVSSKEVIDSTLSTKFTGSQTPNSSVDDIPAFEESTDSSLETPVSNSASISSSSVNASSTNQSIPVSKNSSESVSFDDLPDFSSEKNPPVSSENQASLVQETTVSESPNSLDSPEVISPDADVLLFEEIFVQRERFIELLNSLKSIRSIVDVYNPPQKNLFLSENKLNAKLQKMNVSFGQMNKKLMSMDNVLVKSKG